VRLTLRKGHSSVFLQYARLGGDSIGAECFELEPRNDVTIVRFRLRPVDGNQRSDEERLHELELAEVRLNDGYIIKNVSRFIRSSHIKSDSIALEILSRAKTLRFSVHSIEEGQNDIRFILHRSASQQTAAADAAPRRG
jgi:hypothetical protein